MKEKTKKPLCWTAAGILLALLTVVFIVYGLSGAPVVAVSSAAAQEEAAQVMDTLIRGDRAALSGMLYGNPRLDPLPEDASSAERLIWERYLDSFNYHFEDAVTATDNGISIEMTLRCLDIPALMEVLKTTTPTLLNQKAQALGDESLIYDSEQNYRPEFLDAVLQEAVKTSLDAQPETREHRIILEFRRWNGQWKLVPSEEVQDLLTGFLAEGR